jgi:hypothetical protein
MATRTIRYEYQRVAGDAIAREVAKTGSGVLSIEETVADSATDAEIVFALDVSAVKAFMIVSDRDVLVQTNDGSSPDDSLSLLAGEPYVWHDTAYDSFLLTQDITSIFVTNASGGIATLIIEAVFDVTP